jgi:hypothetical protein
MSGYGEVSSSGRADGGAYGIGLPPQSSVTGMSPEYIMMRCRSQLQEMDRQARQSMQYVDDQSRKAEALGREIQELRDLESLMRDSEATGDDGFDIDQLKEDKCAQLAEFLGIEDATSYSPEDITAEFGRIMRERFGIEPDGHDGHFDLNALKNEIDNRIESQRRLNAGNEMLMMNLQNLMQQRSQALQAGSNFLASVHDATKTIVGNIR